MAEPNLINRGTLLGLILGVMLGTGTTLGTVAFLRARSQDAANREQPHVEPPANTDADKRALAKRDRDDKIRRLELLASTLRLEIEAAEKQIELLERTGSPEDNAKRLSTLRQRLTDSDAELNMVRRDVLKLEAERKTLQLQIDEKPGPVDADSLAKQVERDPRVANAQAALDARQAEAAKLKNEGAKDGDPRMVRLNIEVEKLRATLGEARKAAEADAMKVLHAAELATLKSRAAQLDATLAIRKELSDRLKEERDNLKKLIDAGAGSRLDTKTMREGLKPQRELLDKTNAELARLRIEAKLNE